MKRFLIVLGVLVLLSIVIYDWDKKESLTIKQTYGDWRETYGDELGLVARAIHKNNIRGCGEFRIRTKYDSDGECMLACTSDGVTWNYYLLWINTGDMLPLNNPTSNDKGETEYIEAPK